MFLVPFGVSFNVVYHNILIRKWQSGQPQSE